MVRSVQNDSSAAGRDRARKSGCGQGCESKRGRQPESLIQVQHSGDSGAALLQERPTTRPGYRSYEQEGFTQPTGSTGVNSRVLPTATACGYSAPGRKLTLNRSAALEIHPANSKV